MDREEKEAYQASQELLKVVGALMAQAEEALSDPNNQIPDDIEERLAEVQGMLEELEEGDAKLRKELELDDELYGQLLADPANLPTPKRKLFDRVSHMLVEAQVRSYAARADNALSAARRKDPDFGKSLVSASPLEGTESEVAKKSEPETAEEKRSRLRAAARRKAKKRYKGSGGFKNWEKL